MLGALFDVSYADLFEKTRYIPATVPKIPTPKSEVCDPTVITPIYSTAPS